MDMLAMSCHNFFRRALLLLGFWGMLLTGFSQKESINWYFGQRAGFTFDEVPPRVRHNGKMEVSGGCATMSTKEGRLLFYTNGMQVWDSTHQIMQNGSGLLASVSGQAVVVVPKPSSPEVYFIIVCSSYRDKNGELSYSELDMKLNSGKGGIVANKKNVSLRKSINEKITAVKHGNRMDYWLVATRHGSDSVFSFRISGSGIDHTPVVSRTGKILGPYPEDGIGSMKVSLDGKKIAYTGWSLMFSDSLLDSVYVGDFDPQNGKVRDVWAFSANVPYGLEFSLKARFLYVTSARDATVSQYDLSLGRGSAFMNSAKILDTFRLAPYGLQMGPDGKIYISESGMQFYRAIHAPDSVYPYCRLQKKGTYFGPYGVFQRDLPHFITSDLIKMNLDYRKECDTDTVFFRMSGNTHADSVKWDFGDPGSGKKNVSGLRNQVHHVYKQTGHYLVKVVSYYPASMDTFSLKVYFSMPVKPELGKDTTVCRSILLKPMNPDIYKRYTWSGISGSQRVAEVTQSGTYILDTEDSAGCISSDTIEVNNLKSALFIPNVFTPGKDSLNDCYHLGGVDSYCGDAGELIIFDRWGLQVFKGDILNSCWNGRVNNTGKALPPGTYYYILKLSYVDKDRVTEDISTHGVIHLVKEQD